LKLFINFYFRNFFEDCKRLLPDGAAYSARRMGLWAHSTCLSTMPARELSANYSKETMATSPNLYPRRYVWGAMHKAF